MNRYSLIPIIYLVWLLMLDIALRVSPMVASVQRPNRFPHENEPLTSTNTSESISNAKASTITGNGGLFGNQDHPYIHWDDGTCVGWKANIIYKEMPYALRMARQAQIDPRSGSYFNFLFHDSLPHHMRDGTKPTNVFQRAAEVIDGHGSNTFKIRCHGHVDKCKNQNYFVFTSDDGKGKRILNFCDQFFTSPELKSAEERMGECSTMSLREAHRTRAAMIVHEATHIRFVMNGNDDSKGTVDYAYGVKDCLELARGVFNRHNAPYRNGYGDKKKQTAKCPDPQDP